MIELTLWGRISDWLAYLPVRLAYWIIWLAARLNLGAARQVYAAMWDANLNLPTLSDSDGSQEGEDALAASSETTARAEGIATPLSGNNKDVRG